MAIHFSERFFAPENEEGAEEEVEAETEEDAPEEEESTEADDAPEGEEETPAPKKEGRYQRLANEARTEREARIRAEARAAALEESRNAPRQDDGERARIRAEKMALMDPTERKLFEQEETIRQLQQTQSLGAVQMADYKDEAKYDALAATNTPKGKAYAKHKDWIENTLANERKQGRNPSRELLIRIKLGDDMLNAKPSKALVKEKAAAAGRVQAATAKPVSGRGDAGGKKTGADDSLAAIRERILERERTGR